MKTLLEEYGIAIFAAVAIISMIIFVTPLAQRVNQTLQNEANIQERKINSAMNYSSTEELKEIKSSLANERNATDWGDLIYATNIMNVSGSKEEKIEIYNNSANKVEISNIEASTEWALPLELDSFSITSVPWRYDNGAAHTGLDHGAETGTSILAPANGVIVASYNGCGTGAWNDKSKCENGLNAEACSSCGSSSSTISGGGNQVWMITSVNDEVYVLAFFHLEKGSPIAVGTIVDQGDEIGKVGSSGNSTGPHCHIEAYYLGKGDFNDIANDYMLREHSISWNCGWGESAIARSHVCENEKDKLRIFDDNTAYCRMDIRDIIPEYVRVED